MYLFFFFKQKTAYEMRISDWSSDVCSSDLPGNRGDQAGEHDQRIAIEISRLNLLRGDCAAPNDPGGAIGAETVDQADVAALPEQIGKASCRERVCPYG